MARSFVRSTSLQRTHHWIERKSSAEDHPFEHPILELANGCRPSVRSFSTLQAGNRKEGKDIMRRTDAILSVGMLVLVLLALALVAATGSTGEFVGWAWERHHNVLSWYIRPLFFLPFCFFAYKRSLSGMILTLVALATSMFWFPAPEHSNPNTLEFLAVEREYLTGDWTMTKVLMALLVPLSFAA